MPNFLNNKFAIAAGALVLTGTATAWFLRQDRDLVSPPKNHTVNLELKVPALDNQAITAHLQQSFEALRSTDQKSDKQNYAIMAGGTYATTEIFDNAASNSGFTRCKQANGEDWPIESITSLLTENPEAKLAQYGFFDSNYFSGQGSQTPLAVLTYGLQCPGASP